MSLFTFVIFLIQSMDEYIFESNSLSILDNDRDYLE